MNNNDENDGLRAFAMSVGTYDGASAPTDDTSSARPHWIERDGKRIEVAEIESQWREEERLGFRVRLADGSKLLLYYVPELDLWSGVTVAPTHTA